MLAKYASTGELLRLQGQFAPAPPMAVAIGDGRFVWLSARVVSVEEPAPMCELELLGYWWCTA